MRRIMSPALSSVASTIDRCGITPNAVTYTSLLLAIGSGVAAAVAAFYTAAILLLISGICDVLDGELARISGRSSRFGALLDSTIDRISDGAPLIGLLFFYTRYGSLATTIVGLAILSAYTVSYVRARAEALGAKLPWLWMRRGERLIILCFVLVLCKLNVLPREDPAMVALGVIFFLGLLSCFAFISALIAARRIFRQDSSPVLIPTAHSVRDS